MFRFIAFVAAVVLVSSASAGDTKPGAEFRLSKEQGDGTHISKTSNATGTYSKTGKPGADASSSNGAEACNTVREDAARVGRSESGKPAVDYRLSMGR